VWPARQERREGPRGGPACCRATSSAPTSWHGRRVK
jgi:hypothetical protein